MKNNRIYKLTLCALYCAGALITFTIESLFPPIVLPGARLGLSNVFILLCACTLGGSYAFATLVIKTVIGSLFGGNVSMIMYSLPAGAISLTIQLVLLSYTKKTSLVCISVTGAVINTACQNAMFCLVAGLSKYFAFLPYLTLIAVPAGVLVGFTVTLIVKRLPVHNQRQKN